MGLMTGDVSINPNAQCIVMTTEILRSMLYRYVGRIHPVRPYKHLFFNYVFLYDVCTTSTGMPTDNLFCMFMLAVAQL